MKHWYFVILLLLLTAAASANPTLMPDPSYLIPYTIVLGSASVVEASIVTLLLLFWGIEPKPLCVAVIVGNLVIYFAAFLPMLNSEWSLWMSETLVVGLDAALLKTLTCFTFFRDLDFRTLRWRYALLIAAVGNLVSWSVGVIAAA